MSSEPTALDLLEVDIDARLLDVWSQVWMIQEWDEEIVAPCIRVAYWNGYTDALTEEARGSLYRDHGLTPPSQARQPDIP
jgi:hypothetical protein